MRLTNLRFVLLLFLVTPLLNAQDHSIVKDLKSEWQVYKGERYVPFATNESDIKTIYFSLEPSKLGDGVLRVSSNEPLTIFINGQLFTTRSTRFDLPIDSLQKIFPAPVLLVGIHQEKIRAGGLQTLILARSPELSKPEVEVPMRFSSFRDFVIVGMLILVSVLIVVVQLNPKLASDYFSIIKMFFMREGEDSQMYSRITSSINILFCMYCSLMIGYYLMIIFRFIPSHYVVALGFQADTFGSAMFLWIKLSAIILAIVFLKVVLVYCLSIMFGLTEIAGIHIFNWIRLLLVVFGILTILLFLYFILHGQNENFHIVLLKVISWLLVGWMFLIILKLSKRMTHSMFHLFSYICATELIPLLITIKVLYN
ncbi:MAG TPA: DUF4271 domain-containing protein [Chryseolinea sp.]|jgi:hypothetical protein|nr:DUF4271 domain-containing protein [Chryseolinea sp.]